MEVLHTVTFEGEDGVDDAIESMGIRAKRSQIFERYILTIEITESDPNWKTVTKLIKEKEALDLFETYFTDEEVINAEWSRLEPAFEHGYPQPQGTWVKNPPNYSYKCMECGVFIQEGHFALKKEPGLGKHDFMTPYWTHAFFCTTRVLKTLLEYNIKGYEAWQVMIRKTKLPSTLVSQLFVPCVCQPGLLDDLPYITCKTCGRQKYHIHNRGIMHHRRDAVLSDLDIFQTHEWFGYGHNAFREIIVSNRFARLIVEKRWKGVRLKVVGLDRSGSASTSSAGDESNRGR